MATRGVRFSEAENKAIDDFLKKNLYFDFSTIARLAILKFIEDPKISLMPSKIKNGSKSDSRELNNG